MHSKNQKRHSSPVPSRSPLVPMKPKASAATHSPGDTLAFRIPKDYPHSRFSKAPLAVYPPKGARNKTCVSLPVVSLEKMPCLGRADSASHVRLTSSSSSSSSSPSSSPLKHHPSPASQRPAEKPMNGRLAGGPSTPSSLDGRPSPARSPLDRRPSSTPSPAPPDRKPSPSPSPSHRYSSLPSSSAEKKNQNGSKVSSKSHKRLSGRVFDPNKHCGVQDPETKRPCTRSLTCKTHSLTHRRAVPGRRKHFDVLLAEHKGRAKEAEGLKEKEKEKEKERDGAQGRREAGVQGQGVTAQEAAASPGRLHCPNGRPLSTLRLRLANAHIPRVPGTSTSSPLPPAPAPHAAAPNPEPSSHAWPTSAEDGGRLSGDEAEAETPEDPDRPAFHFSARHPQPLGLCVFSSRLMGRGHFVFDRRWDRMRLALQSMVEKHLNAQMWRKVPPAVESLLSLSSSPSSISSPQAHPPRPASATSPLLHSSSANVSRGVAFPQSASSSGPLAVRDAPPCLAPAAGKAHNSAHKASPPSKEAEDPAAGPKKRKNSSYSSFSSSSSLPTVDIHRRNGSSYHPPLPSPAGAAAGLAGKKGPGREGNGFWGGDGGWSSRADGSQSHNSQSGRNPGTTGTPFSSSREPALGPGRPPAPGSGPASYDGTEEGRKRRSPTSYKRKASKMSRPAGSESLFGKGNESGRILASGPEAPRQAKLHH